MKRQTVQFNKIKLLGLLGVSCFGCLAFVSPHKTIEAAKSVATHIGTFDGRTTFTTSSSNGINPGLFIEVMDDEGNLTQYESEEGTITIPDTKEGAYVTQAKLLGKTKYVDEETGEILGTWEEGRNLRLESSKNPGLTTSGKNLFTDDLLNGKQIKIEDGGYVADGVQPSKNNSFAIIKGFKEATQYTFSASCLTDGTWTHMAIVYKDHPYNEVTGFANSTGKVTSLSGKTVDYITIYGNKSSSIYDIQLEEGSNATSYEPYQSSIITVNEEVELRGIGDVRDELDLIKGKVTENIMVAELNGTESWIINPNNNTDTSIVFESGNAQGIYLQVLSEDFPTIPSYRELNDFEECITLNGPTYFYMKVKRNRLKTEDVAGFKEWLAENKPKILHISKTPTIKTVALNSNYFFKPINKDSIQVTGTIAPLVGSITVPTTPVSFVLNPNEEARQQFIAPEFSVSNEANAPIKLALNSFEQTTNVLTDVLPDKYNSWEGLNKKESKDIALALVPKMSDGWLSLNEGPRYVAGALSNELGTIKAKSSVDFTFSALHGQAFEETLSPSYRLGFVFEFMN